MRKYIKILFTFLVGVLLVLGLTACGDSDQDKVDKAYEQLEIQFTSPDTMNSVTKDLILRTSVGEVSVEWASDKANIISTSGKVVRPAASAEDTRVKLTATLTLGKAEKIKEFMVNVIKEVDYFALLSGLDLGLQKDGNIYVTSESFTLPTTVGDQTIVWTSADQEVISNSGEVTRPKFGQADKIVTLVASVGGEQVSFLVKVLAQTEEAKEDILAQAKDALLIPGISNGVAQDVALPMTVGQKGVTVTWTSSNEAVLSGEGVVHQGEEDITVVLTATLHLEGYTGEPVTKEFTVIVLAMEQGKLLASLAEIKDLTANPKNTYVQIQGVTVVGITNDGFMIYDGETLVFVYDRGVRSEIVTQGAVIDIRGETNIYFGAVQLQNSSSAAKPIVVKPSNAAAKTITPTVVDNIETFLTGKPVEYNDTTMFVFEYIQLTAYVRVYSDDNYDTVLVDDPTYRLQTAANTPHDGKGFVVYYQSNQRDLKPYDNVKVTINAFFYAYRSDRKVFTILYTGGADDVVFGGTDAEKLDVIEAVARGRIEERYTANATIDLLTEFLGATITWTSSNDAMINPTTGAVTVPATGEETVTLTAVIQLPGLEPRTVNIPVKLGLPDVQSIADAKLVTSGQVRIKGVVTGYAANDTLAIQDATGGISLYIRNSSDEVKAALKAALGKTVDLLGTRGAYNGLLQVNPIEIVSVTDGTAVEPVDISALTFDEAGLLPHQGKVVNLSKVTVSAFNKDSYGNVSFTLTTDDAKVIKFKWDSRTPLDASVVTALEAVQNGDKLNFTDLILGWASNAPLLAPRNATTMAVPELTDQEAVDATEVLVTGLIKDQYAAPETVVLPTENQGVTIAWASDNEALFNPTTGVVTMPASGQVTVTLTVTLTKNAVNKTVTITTAIGTLPTSSIADAKLAAKDALVKVEGVLTAYVNNQSFTIEDATGAMLLYVTADQVATLEAALGKTVTVEGIKDTYRGNEQLKNITFTVGEVATMPAAVSLDTGALDGTTLLPHQSKFANINDVTVSGYSKAANGTVSFTLTRQDAATINFRWDYRVTNLPTEVAAKLNALQNGDIINIENANIGWFNDPQLLPTQTMVITDAVLTDAQKVALAKAALVTEWEGKSFVQQTAVALPATGEHGTTIAWAMDPADAIVDGMWKVVTANTPVVLTASVTSGSLTEDQALNVTILVEAPAPTSLATLAYTDTTTTTNMVAGNNAASVGLDATLFTVTSTERVNNPLHIGLNKSGQIRLYGSSDGGGNILTVEIAAGYKITGIKFTFGATIAPALIKAGATELHNGALTANGVLTFDALDTNIFSIQNIVTGGTTQIYLLSVEITYQTV